MSLRRLFSSILVLGAICLWGCSTSSPKPEWHEERAFLEDAIRWHWNDKVVVLESIQSDSGIYLSNIKAVVDNMRNSKYFTERFCNEIEQKYSFCDEYYRNDANFERHECLDSDLVTEYTYPKLDSVVIKKGSRNGEGVEVVSEIYASYGSKSRGEMDRHHDFEITFFLVKLNDGFMIDNSSALEDHFFYD